MSELPLGKRFVPTSTDPWVSYLLWAREFVGATDWDKFERDYKLIIAHRLVRVRRTMLSGDPSWAELLPQAFGSPNNLTHWRFNQPFLRWCRDDPDRAQNALKIIWDENRSMTVRFNDFIHLMNDEPLNVSIAEASFLHMANDPIQFPLFRARAVARAYKLTGQIEPRWSKDETGERYDFFLDFLDELLTRAQAADIHLRDRLDAQSIVWSISGKDLPAGASEASRAAFARYREEGLAEAARRAPRTTH